MELVGGDRPARAVGGRDVPVVPRALAADPLALEQLVDLHGLDVPRVPEHVVRDGGEDVGPGLRAALPAGLLERDLAAEALGAEDLVEERADEVDVVIANLDE